MSKEDGALNQHIVPQAHLDRFTDSGSMLHVHRFVDDEKVKVYPTRRGMYPQRTTTTVTTIRTQRD